MNNSEEARRGFLTFVTTLVIATGVFFVTYFAVNLLNKQATGTTERASSQSEPQVYNEKPSVFGDLVGNRETLAAVGGTTGAVLSGATEATGGAVPTTGSESIVSVIVSGAAMIFLGIYFGTRNSRALAIRAFERRITKGF